MPEAVPDAEPVVLHAARAAREAAAAIVIRYFLMLHS
jgi:hypothetical protein